MAKEGGKRRKFIFHPRRKITRPNWLYIRRRRLINLSAISHHHQTLVEIVFGWWKISQSRKMLSGLWKWSREDGEKRKTCQLPSPFGHSLRFAKHFRAIYLVDSDSFADANISIANFFSACTSYNSSINQSAVKWCFHKNNNTKPRPRTPLRKR